ncbi:hypothetical protein PL373_13415 [Tenacibaculum maritimum]|nr:hypothetical protein [Tenacibaculum maritimum]MDB0602128.1 hypothetical protein [Tenacibaculum maritimum]MDB0613803.1 hypothetical protein [Tenacibaculum maritimum]
MTESIKNLWKRMLPETKKEAVQCILTESEFDVSDEIYVKQTWIWGARIPEKHQEKVVEIFQKALKSQSDKTEKLMS